MISIISEIGINHNGDINLAKELITASAIAGANYVKLQKRNPDICVPDSQKYKLKETPWGTMTYLEYKKRLEFSQQQILELYYFAKQNKIELFASVWDKDSVDVMSMVCKIGKIPSALITNHELCVYARSKFEKLLISTGMSTEEEVEKCVKLCNPDVIMHTNSTYPSPSKDLFLNYIPYLKEKYPDKEIGYSGHEFGLVTTFATVPLGVTWIERHVTKDHKLWGSDQKSSVEISGLIKLVKGIRSIESAFSIPKQPRFLLNGEHEKKETLRGT